MFQLFFWFFPPGPEGSLDDLIFWYVVNLDDGFQVAGAVLKPSAFKD